MASYTRVFHSAILPYGLRKIGVGSVRQLRGIDPRGVAGLNSVSPLIPGTTFEVTARLFNDFWSE